jgi:hypothetical protein
MFEYFPLPLLSPIDVGMYPKHAPSPGVMATILPLYVRAAVSTEDEELEPDLHKTMTWRRTQKLEEPSEAVVRAERGDRSGEKKRGKTSFSRARACMMRDILMIYTACESCVYDHTEDAMWAGCDDRRRA